MDEVEKEGLILEKIPSAKWPMRFVFKEWSSV
jgi:hypothetical protein